MRHRLKQYVVLIALIIICLIYPTTEIFSARQSAIELNQSESSLTGKNFWKLNRALAKYQEAINHPWSMIPEEPFVLKLGIKDHAVLLLRERLRMTDDLTLENDIGTKLYDKRLRDAVKIFQERHGLKADGVVGRDTRIQLNIVPEVRYKQIVINMQRWANLSNKLGSRFIMVNIPDFHMYLVDNNQEILSLRAIVGKPDLPTPELSSKITRIIFNPCWNIPNKIVINDIAHKVIEDPSYLYRTHMRVFRSEDDDNSQINASNIDWQDVEMNGFHYHLRQDPGPENALGLVKFEFQNTHDVYMHDTPTKDLFNQGNRSFSHGCIRLENPFSLVEYLMKDNPNWSDERLQDILDSGKTHYTKVENPIPIFITYMTAWVDENGLINFRDDIYQLDQETEYSLNENIK